MSYVQYRQEFDRKIDEFLKKPLKPRTKEESRATLRSLGIIDENDEITPAFQGIFVAKKNNENEKESINNA